MSRVNLKKQNSFNKNITKTYKTGNIQRAIELCQSELLKDPTNADLHVQLGDLYLEWHLDIHQARTYADEAITEYQRALETYINSDRIYFKIGLAFFHKAELDKAINYFEMAIENNPKHARAHYMIAEALMKKGNFQQAIDFAKKSIKLSPFRAAKAHYLISTLLKISSFKSFKTTFKSAYEFLMFTLTLPFDKEAKKDFFKALSYFQFLPMLFDGLRKAQTKGLSQAIATYQQAVEKAPGFILLYSLLGGIYKELGRYEDAICEFKMGIWLNPLNISCYRGLCQSYEEQGDYDSAIEIYQKLIAIQPYVAEYHSNLANILYLKGDIPAAVAHYQNAITLNPRKTWTSVIAQTLGYVHQESGKDLDSAISSYHCAYLLTPKDMDIYVNLGSAFYDKGDYDNALAVYNRALELEPQNAKIHCNLGYLYWGKGDLDEAIHEYELSLKYDKTYDISYNNLGVIYLDDLGRIQKAIELFQEAVKYNPNYALAYYNLARSVAITGDKIEAAKLYQIALDINSVTNEIDPQDITDKLQGLFN